MTICFLKKDIFTDFVEDTEICVSIDGKETSLMFVEHMNLEVRNNPKPYLKFRIAKYFFHDFQKSNKC